VQVGIGDLYISGNLSPKNRRLMPMVVDVGRWLMILTDETNFAG
jgi:hypothetical protein